jgi:hypothetical protein
MELLMRTKAVLLLSVVILTLAGCVRQFKLAKADTGRPSAWPGYRHDPSAAGVLGTTGFAGKLDTIWCKRTGDKPSGPLTLLSRYVVVPSAKKRFRFFDIATGSNRGRIKFLAPPQTQLQVLDSIGFLAIGPPRNTLYGIHLGRLKTIWKGTVKDAPPGSILVSNRLIIGSADGTVSAYDPMSGHREWIFQADDRFVAPISYQNGKLYQPSDKGVIHVLSEVNGLELYQVKLKGPVVSAAAVSDGLFVGDVLGNIYSIAPSDSTILWQSLLTGPIWTTPAVAGDFVIVGHSRGDIVALDRLSGRQVWKYALNEVIKASPIVVGDVVVIASMKGTVLTLKLHSGELIARTQLNGAVAVSPISDGSYLYLMTQNGRLLCLGERNEQSQQNHH